MVPSLKESFTKNCSDEDFSTILIQYRNDRTIRNEEAELVFRRGRRLSKRWENFQHNKCRKKRLLGEGSSGGGFAQPFRHVMSLETIHQSLTSSKICRLNYSK